MHTVRCHATPEPFVEPDPAAALLADVCWRLVAEGLSGVSFRAVESCSLPQWFTRWGMDVECYTFLGEGVAP